MKIKITALLLFIAQFCFSKDILIPKVDERFELTSIAFRIAGAEEYVNNQLEEYTSSIDNYFEKYKDHDLIEYIKEIRGKDQIAYDAVSGSAACLKMVNNKIVIDPNTDIQKYIASDNRWSYETLTKYIALLNKFYKDTNFHKFYTGHHKTYISAEQELRNLLEEKPIRTEWFESFFGKPLSSRVIYIGMCNGPHNYALLINGNTDPSILVGASRDKNGKLSFASFRIIPLIIHEFCHSFTNPLIDKYESQMIQNADIIFPHVQDKMVNYAYGSSKSLLYESFNHLFTTMYFIENDKDSSIVNIKWDITQAEDRGFIWMRDMVHYIQNFQSNRGIYPTIDEFMPQLAGFMKYTADNIEDVIKRQAYKTPIIVSVYPSLNVPVDPKVGELKIEFSLPMASSTGLRPLDDYPPPLDTNLTMADLPNTVFWSKDKKTLIIKLKLNPNVHYGIVLPHSLYQSEDYYAIPKNFTIEFKTKE